MLNNDDDIKGHNYDAEKDELYNDDPETDVITEELTDDPTNTFKIPADEFEDELDKEPKESDEEAYIENPDDPDE